MRITFVTRKFGNVERNSHCDVLHITPIRVSRLFLLSLEALCFLIDLWKQVDAVWQEESSRMLLAGIIIIIIIAIILAGIIIILARKLVF